MIGNHLEPFKFWCQKVLPNVYDDSLSYYEYLCKMNKYLNDVIEQMNTLTDNMEDYEENLTSIWEQTKGWIDNYFDNLDVQTEINNKLDEMAENGELFEVFNTFIGYVTPEMYGAVGDGVADDTSAIQEAINSGRTVIATKNYLISDTLTSVKYIDGYGTGKITINNANIDIIHIVEGTTQGAFIKGLTLMHTERGTGNGIVHSGGNTSQLRIEDVTLINNNSAIYSNDDNIYSSIFNNIRIYSFNQYGIYLRHRGSTGNNYCNIYIHNNDIECISGIYLFEETDSVLENINIEWGNYLYYIQLGQCNGIIANSIHFENDYAPQRACFNLSAKSSLKCNDIGLLMHVASIYLIDMYSNENFFECDILNVKAPNNITITIITPIHETHNSTIEIKKAITTGSTVTFGTSYTYDSSKRPVVKRFDKNIYWDYVGNDGTNRYLNNDTLIPDCKFGDIVNYNKGYNGYTRYLCIASGVANNVEITTATGTLGMSYLEMDERPSFVVEPRMSLLFNGEKYISLTGVYASGNKFRITLNTGVTSGSAGTGTLYQTTSQYKGLDQL